ncbi:MAG: molybdenum cofactor biosynthesis protein MoaE [Bacteroidetes bacterium]|nr:molybdenum cofactor biosynthesis protein MoaE [Bacteroidota bacterium]
MTSSTSSRPAAVDKSSHLSARPIHIPALLEEAHHPGAGAVVLFSGETRDHSHGRTVTHLDYEAQESMANKMIGEIVNEALVKWSLKLAIAVHRTGRVAVGETAVVVITAAAHRREAYAANRYIIDRVKHEAPIWKREYFTDGSSEWGGNCDCQKITGDPNKHIYDHE